MSPKVVKTNFKRKNDNRLSWSTKNDEDRHRGSYDLEEVKKSVIYQRKLQQIDPFKRKYAICIGYLGTNYQGLQINPGAKSIEAEVERALLLAGAIHESNFGFFHKVQWTRAARTDRGVHAAAQCCAAKLLLPLRENHEPFLSEVNSFLPEDITIHALTKVSKGFNAKLSCTKRRYDYLFPSYMLIEKEVMKEYLHQISEEGVFLKSDIAGEMQPDLPPHYFSKLKDVREKHLKQYRVTSAQMELLKTALQQYVGTKSYHNFTSGKDASDANSKRYILSFEIIGTPFLNPNNGVEWIKISVLGQSFLLNQIRKMVGLAVELCRKSVTISTINDAFSNGSMDIPMAPGVGLYLNELFFEGYNLKQRRERENKTNIVSTKGPVVENFSSSTEINTEPTEEIDSEIHWSRSGSASSQRISRFIDETIVPHIMIQEETSLQYVQYLDSLRLINPKCDLKNQTIIANKEKEIKSHQKSAMTTVMEEIDDE